MYLTAYHFAGDRAQLLRGHDRLLAAIPPESVTLHLVVVDDAGITVLDACPSRAVFEAFSASPEFRAAVDEAGLPRPRIDPLGDIVAATLPSPEAAR